MQIIRNPRFVEMPKYIDGTTPQQIQEQDLEGGKFVYLSGGKVVYILTNRDVELERQVKNYHRGVNFPIRAKLAPKFLYNEWVKRYGNDTEVTSEKIDHVWDYEGLSEFESKVFLDCLKQINDPELRNEDDKPYRWMEREFIEEFYAQVYDYVFQWHDETPFEQWDDIKIGLFVMEYMHNNLYLRQNNEARDMIVQIIKKEIENNNNKKEAV